MEKMLMTEEQVKAALLEVVKNYLGETNDIAVDEQGNIDWGNGEKGISEEELFNDFIEYIKEFR